MLESIAFILGTTFMYSTPLIYTAMGGLISENSGVVNIGLEGMMTLGAFVGAAATILTGSPWLGFFAAGIAGILLASLHATASIFFRAGQVISGIAINFLGAGISVFACKVLFDGTTMTPPIPMEQKMPRPLNSLLEGHSFLDGIFNQYATVYLVVLLVFVLWFFLYQTPWGLRVRSVGEHPKAAETLGIRVLRLRFICVMASGLFAAAGGAALSTAVVANFRPTLISGQGFIALAAVIFGQWKPWRTMGACLLFGLAQALVVFIGGQEGINISSQLLSMLPYVLTLLILIGFVGKTRSPAANGVPYEK